jgi:release factor glutamine methyltransferase
LSDGTILERVADARQRLRGAGISPIESDLDARLLAEHVLGWTPERYFISEREPAPDGFAERYQELVDRRAAREPIAYIVGRREFWNLLFEVTPAVLIPRPETELIVESALELFPRRDEALTVVDACTGCGCIAVALARERPAARIVATDISEPALETARRNAALHGVQVLFEHRNLLDGIPGPLDLVVANPPYVRDGDRRGLQPEVRDHEPGVALFGGGDGLDIIRALVAQAAERVRPTGYLIFEFGFGQDPAVEALIAGRSDLRLIGLKRDLQGIARTAVCQNIRQLG